MEEEKDPSPNYIKAFNNGYLLAKHEPELSTHLATQKENQSESLEGLAAGKKEFDNEITKWRNSFSKGTPARDDRDLGKER